jgi:hypothetical protein
MGMDLGDGPVFPELQSQSEDEENPYTVLERVKTIKENLIYKRGYDVPTRFQNRLYLYIVTTVDQLKDLDDFPIHRFTLNQCLTALKLIEEGLLFLDSSYANGDYVCELLCEHKETEKTPLLGEQNFYRNVAKINAGMRFLQKYQCSIRLPFLCICKTSGYTASSQFIDSDDVLY